MVGGNAKGWYMTIYKGGRRLTPHSFGLGQDEHNSSLQGGMMMSMILLDDWPLTLLSLYNCVVAPLPRRTSRRWTTALASCSSSMGRNPSPLVSIAAWTRRHHEILIPCHHRTKTRMMTPESAWVVPFSSLMTVALMAVWKRRHSENLTPYRPRTTTGLTRQEPAWAALLPLLFRDCWTSLTLTRLRPPLYRLLILLKYFL